MCAAIPTLLVAFTLLTHSLEAKSFWIDEYFTRRVAEAPLAALLPRVAADLHPPAYFGLVWLWARLAGYGEFSLRYLSVLAACLGLGLTARLAGALNLPPAPRRMTLLALGLSPLYGLYGRMARYYSLAAVVGLLSTLALLAALQKGGRGRWAAYAFTAALLLYTDYPTAVLLAIHCIHVAAWHRGKFAAWLLALSAAGLAFLPWAGTLAAQIGGALAGRVTDFASGAAGMAIRPAFALYAFSVGETIFPWEPLALAGMAVGLGAAARGMIAGSRRSFAALFTLLPIAGATVLTALFSPGTTFANLPSRTLYALPYFVLAVGLPRRSATAALAYAILLTANLAAWLNYFSNRHFVNPIYTLPAREIARSLDEVCRPDDLILTPMDSLVAFYLRRDDCRRLFTHDAGAVLAGLQASRPARVYLVTLGRDSTAGYDPAQVRDWLDQNYRLVQSQGYAEQDETYRRVKSWLLRREAYRYKVVVEMYRP